MLFNSVRISMSYSRSASRKTSPKMTSRSSRKMLQRLRKQTSPSKLGLGICGTCCPYVLQKCDHLIVLLYSIIKAFILFTWKQVGATWDPKAVTSQTPYEIRNFILQKCGERMKGYEGQKVSNVVDFGQ